ARFRGARSRAFIKHLLCETVDDFRNIVDEIEDGLHGCGDGGVDGIFIGEDTILGLFFTPEMREFKSRFPTLFPVAAERQTVCEGEVDSEGSYSIVNGGLPYTSVSDKGEPTESRAVGSLSTAEVDFSVDPERTKMLDVEYLTNADSSNTKVSALTIICNEEQTSAVGTAPPEQNNPRVPTVVVDRRFSETPKIDDAEVKNGANETVFSQDSLPTAVPERLFSQDVTNTGEQEGSEIPTDEEPRDTHCGVASGSADSPARNEEKSNLSSPRFKPLISLCADGYVTEEGIEKVSSTAGQRHTDTDVATDINSTSADDKSTEEKDDIKDLENVREEVLKTAVESATSTADANPTSKSDYLNSGSMGSGTADLPTSTTADLVFATTPPAGNDRDNGTPVFLEDLRARRGEVLGEIEWLQDAILSRLKVTKNPISLSLERNRRI
ncbi:hypothetical protein HK102_008130, partial [Quaeritorhiza haematococci]